MDSSTATPPLSKPATDALRTIVTTTVISVTRPVLRVAFGPFGNVAMVSSSWIREYDGLTKNSRLVTTDVLGKDVRYSPETEKLEIVDATVVDAIAPNVTDAEARERLAAVGLPFVAIQRNTVRRGASGPSYVVWTHSVSTLLTGAVLHGPVLVTPERIVPLSKSETSVRVLMDGDDVHLVERKLESYTRVTVTRLGETSGFDVPHDQDLSSWTSVVRTPRHALVSGHRGYVADLRLPGRVTVSDWKIEGEPRRLPGGAAIEARNGTTRAVVWLHENGISVFLAQSPLASLVRTGPRELTGWHMRGQSELVVRTYALPRD